MLLLAALACVPAAARHIMLADSVCGSAIYPGTVHTFTVSVPDSYRPASPAALFLGLDGVLCDAPALIDSLSACGVLPPAVIGVYLQPGIVRDSVSGRIVRYNRSNEFDATDARFATFLETELLPAVEAMSTPDGRPLRLTRNAADRLIFGLSSGGIAAFTAAWHRPDLFAKVFSGCGTFVPMRGGHNLQAVVRKHEPRPLRVFLQDGFDDCWNPAFGSWFDANATLGTALRFAGCDCRFDWAEGVHSVRRATEIMPDVLTWMWRDGTDAHIVLGTTANDFLAPLLIAGEDWQPVPPQGVLRADSVVRAVYPGGALVAEAAPGSNYLMQYIAAPDGTLRYGQPFYWLHSYDNSQLGIGSLAFDGNGNLWAVTTAGIQICDQNGRVRAILALPAGINPSTARLRLTEGAAELQGRSPDGCPAAFRRRLNIALPGPQLPSSQGQA